MLVAIGRLIGRLSIALLLKERGATVKDCELWCYGYREYSRCIAKWVRVPHYNSGVDGYV